VVTLLERDAIGAGATRAAAGMLAPIAEADFGRAGQQLLELGVEAAAAWPAFAAELEQASAMPSTLRCDGTLILARDGDEAAVLEREADYRLELGLEVTRLLPSAARALEPALAPTLRAALSVASEASVDPRCVCAALAVAARAAGAELREGAEVMAIEREGVELAGGESLSAEHVVLAAGAWSGRLAPLPVRPVKGQIMRLRDPGGPGLVTRMLRFDGGYLVPRSDGGYVLGASVEERGFDLEVTAGAIHDLLRDAAELVPGLLELEIEELGAGLRPGSPDNLPLIGFAGDDRLIVATGHYRNGILLAPLTATLVLAALDGDALPDVTDPARYAPAGERRSHRKVAI
jgi:glycine oxidase